MGFVVNVLNLFDFLGGYCFKNVCIGIFGFGVDGDFLGWKKIYNFCIKEKIRVLCNMNVLIIFVIIILVLIRMRMFLNWSKRKFFINFKFNKIVIILKLIFLKFCIFYIFKYMYLIDSCLFDFVKCKI